MLVLGFALLLMLLSSLLGSLVTGSNGEIGFMVAFLAYGISMLLYVAVIYFTGHAARMLVALSCIIACGSLLTILFVIEFGIFAPLLGREAAGAIASMIILWSVPVEGHIMTRTIGCHWFIGILIAVVSLALQFSVHSVFAGSG